MPRVMLVTDSKWVVNTVEAALSANEADLEVVENPRKVTELALASRPEVVIVDLQVHSMGGMAVVRDLRSAFQGETRPRMVLLLDRSADRFLARRAGADASVLKPFDAFELREAMVG